MGYSWITRFFLESGCARLRIEVEVGSFGFAHPGQEHRASPRADGIRLRPPTMNR
jgi:hypothetical protein